MGAFNSKGKEQIDTPPTRPCSLKRIEDPRSPTEEISRTPIEVNEKFIRENDLISSQRINALKEQNQYTFDSSPRSRNSDWLSKDFKKLKSNFATALESESATETAHMDQTNSVDAEVSEKENLS